jgi:glycosyltransferase involved in cell wall biosynthesis
MTLTFVIPTRDRAALLRACIGSIDAQDPARAEIEIVVVDDGSVDDTEALVGSVATTARHTVRRVPNAGRGVNAARNTGSKAARGDLVVFIDDDELLPSGYVRRLLQLLERRPDADGYGGPCREPEGPRLRTCPICSLGDARPTRTDGSVLLGGNMALRPSTLLRVGGFDESLSGLGDESEWFHRARQAGARMVYDESLYVWHRQDHLSLVALGKKGFRQGRNLAKYFEIVGSRRPPSLSRALHYAAHAVVRRCARGVLVSARELGYLTATWAPRRRSPR